MGDFVYDSNVYESSVTHVNTTQRTITNRFVQEYDTIGEGTCSPAPQDPGTARATARGTCKSQRETKQCTKIVVEVKEETE